MAIINSKRAFANRSRSAKIRKVMESLADKSTPNADKLDLIDRAIDDLIANPIEDGDDDPSARRASARSWPDPKQRLRRPGPDREEF